MVLLKNCCSIKQLGQIHAQIVVSGFHQDSFLLSELVRFCSLSSTKNLRYARLLLLNSVNSAPSSWNMLIRGYASSDSPGEAVWVFQEMRRRGFSRTELTYPFVFKACAEVSALREGKQVHGEVLKHGLDSNVYVGNNLVHFYGSCKKLVDAHKVFDEMPERTVVSWNALVTAYAENGQVNEVIRYFVEMRDCGFQPDETTMVIVLSVCSEIGNLSLGMWIHSLVITNGIVLNCKLGTALVDMYAKCGAINYAKRVFDTMTDKNVWSWSAMILGLAQHGFATDALDLFSRMKNDSRIRPNYVTFLGLLCACSHAGLVSDGFRYFHDMEHIHGIKPMVIHYGAMVDVLGRAGSLKEAYTFITKMTCIPDPVVWRTLLSACSLHDIDDKSGIGDKVRKKLLQLEPRRSGNFVMVANMYAGAGMWDKATNARRTMKARGLKKMAGESCLESSGKILKFFSGFDDSVGVYPLLHVLKLHMKNDQFLAVDPL